MRSGFDSRWPFISDEGPLVCHFLPAHTGVSAITVRKSVLVPNLLGHLVHTVQKKNLKQKFVILFCKVDEREISGIRMKCIHSQLFVKPNYLNFAKSKMV